MTTHDSRNPWIESAATKGGARAPSAAADKAPALRIGDQERNDAVQQLTRHCSEGRLTLDELDERVAQAWSARTADDLSSLLADLPAVSSAGHEPTLKSWLADGRTLLSSIPRLQRIASAAGFVLLLLFAALLLFYDHGLTHHILSGDGH